MTCHTCLDNHALSLYTVCLSVSVSVKQINNITCTSVVETSTELLNCTITQNILVVAVSVHPCYSVGMRLVSLDTALSDVHSCSGVECTAHIVYTAHHDTHR